jgi:hypothetical protein
VRTTCAEDVWGQAYGSCLAWKHYVSEAPVTLERCHCLSTDHLQGREVAVVHASAATQQGPPMRWTE